MDRICLPHVMRPITGGRGPHHLRWRVNGSTGVEGAPVEGANRWGSKEGNICVTPTAAEGAPAEPESSSNFVDGKSVGDTRDITNYAGETFKVSVTAGR